jgi:hypothetical protein
MRSVPFSIDSCPEYLFTRLECTVIGVIVIAKSDLSHLSMDLYSAYAKSATPIGVIR